METETSLPNPPSNASAPTTAPATVPTVNQPSALQAASEQPATSDQTISAQQAEVAAPAQQAAVIVEGQQAQAAVPAQQQQADGDAASANPTADAMQEVNKPFFTSGTVLRFDMDADDVADSTNLDFRAIRPIFGGKEGGVRHCDYQRVSVWFCFMQAYCITIKQAFNHCICCSLTLFQVLQMTVPLQRLVCFETAAYSCTTGSC